MATTPLEVGEPPEIRDAFARAIDLFESTVEQVPAAGWEAPTPCEGWSVRDLVGHVIGTLHRVHAIAADEAFERDDRPPAGDPLAAVREVAGPAREAVRDLDPARGAEGPMGRGTVAEALAFPVSDLAVHSWDVATAAGLSLELPEELVAHVVVMCSAVPEETMRRAGGFAPPTQAPPGADRTTVLMAWLGRTTSPEG